MAVGGAGPSGSSPATRSRGGRTSSSASGETAARAWRLSAGELVRRAVEAYDAEAAGEAAELRGLLDMLVGVHAETLRRLDATERKLDDTLAYLQGQPGAENAA